MAIQLLNFKIDVLKPDLVSVVTAHVVYFCAFAHSEIFQNNARKLGVSHNSLLQASMIYNCWGFIETDVHVNFYPKSPAKAGSDLNLHVVEMIRILYYSWVFKQG